MPSTEPRQRLDRGDEYRAEAWADARTRRQREADVDMRACGRKMRFTGTTVLKVTDSKIVEERGLDDGVTALTQLGLIKAAAANGSGLGVLERKKVTSHLAEVERHTRSAAKKRIQPQGAEFPEERGVPN